jgi:hypothetical protein
VFVFRWFVFYVVGKRNLYQSTELAVLAQYGIVLGLYSKLNHNKTIIEIPRNKETSIKIQKMNVTGDWESFWCCKLKPRGSEKGKKRKGMES